MRAPLTCESFQVTGTICPNILQYQCSIVYESVFRLGPEGEGILNGADVTTMGGQAGATYKLCSTRLLHPTKRTPLCGSSLKATKVHSSMFGAGKLGYHTFVDDPSPHAARKGGSVQLPPLVRDDWDVQTQTDRGGEYPGRKPQDPLMGPPHVPSNVVYSARDSLVDKLKWATQDDVWEKSKGLKPLPATEGGGKQAYVPPQVKESMKNAKKATALAVTRLGDTVARAVHGSGKGPTKPSLAYAAGTLPLHIALEKTVHQAANKPGRKKLPPRPRPVMRERAGKKEGCVVAVPSPPANPHMLSTMFPGETPPLSSNHPVPYEPLLDPDTPLPVPDPDAKLGIPHFATEGEEEENEDAGDPFADVPGDTSSGETYTSPQFAGALWSTSTDHSPPPGTLPPAIDSAAPVYPSSIHEPTEPNETEEAPGG
eukprot:TRINITY_DN40473_c0_g1_i1.p1 TRINITY_DN40473_c0_g1~~TRINITY_DN40473_c0_g1_i1.p1  ORF type:complete len:493 (-),score=95.89 TRINITY_DN40473_c0_g1_i1:8-1288(-)